MNLARILVIATAVFLIVHVESSRADGANEPIPSFYQEPGKSPNRDYANQHPQEHIDPFTGKLQWHFVDLFIPGNGGFDLKVQRSYSSQSEAFPAYSPVGVGWTMHFGRVLRNASMLLCDTTQIFSPAKNPVLELPDGSRQIMYITQDGQSFITPSFWKGVCSAGNLAVYSPDGTRYDMTIQGMDEGLITHPIHTYYVSKITDRNGNYMTFTYTTAGTNTGVSTVSTSDGRNLTFSYGGSTLSTISDGSRTWTYTYQASSAMMGQVYLTRVQPPSGAAWTYGYYDSAMGTPGAASMNSVTYPTGGTINYSYDFVVFSANPSIPRSTAVKTKTTSDGGNWSFSYKPATLPISNAVQFWANPDSYPAQVDQTTVTGPDTTRIYSHVGYTSAVPGYVWSIGLLVSLRTGTDQTDGYSWAPQVISNQTNERPGGTLIFDSAVGAPVMTNHLSNRNGQAYSVQYGGLDAYGNPGTITETGTEQKVTTVTYAIDTGRWILHVKKDESSVNTTTGENIGSITRTFDPSLNMLSETRYGVATNFTYTSQGDLNTKRDARNNTSTFTSYYRGTPQSESHPEGVSITRVVSAAGNITSQTDGESATTGYTYDNINRLTGITHPAGNPVTVAWTSNTRRVTRGSYVELLTFDGFGRTVREEHQGAGATIYQTTQYDPAGRATFKSYPSSSTGTTFTLDALGRPRTATHPSSTGGTVNRQYGYAANRYQVINERGLSYTYTYRVFGDPDQRDLIAIDAPEPGTSVTIGRNSLGQMTQVTQDGKSRSYVYDTRFFLTSKTDPETGVTTYGRDAVGNMSSRQVGSSATTNFSYDGLNRLWVTNYPSGPTVTRSYYHDDKIKTVDTGLALESYTYDPNKNLQQETLTIASQVFTTGYSYDGNDALNVLTYGSGKTVNYAPDALGRPTQAAPYVTTVSYYPTGQISSMTYANGVTTTVGLNPRMWPSSLTIGPPGLPIFDMGYGYDENGNVLSISNSTDSGFGRGMSYDNIDRVKQVNGSWGAGSFSYDGRGNLKTQRLGNFALDYTYDSSSEKLNSVSGSKTYAFAYDAYGNVTGNGTAAFAYNDASNMRCAKCGQPDQSAFDYDGLNMRVRVVKNGITTYFVYGLDGKLLWEKTPMSTIKEYIYLGGKQVATRQQGITVP